MSLPRMPWLEALALVVVGILGIVGLFTLPADGELLSRLAVGALAAAVFIARGGFGGGPPRGGLAAGPGLAAFATVASSEAGAMLGALF